MRSEELGVRATIPRRVLGADRATAMRTRILSGHSSERVTELLAAKLRDELDAQRSIAHRVWESVRDLFTDRWRKPRRRYLYARSSKDDPILEEIRQAYDEAEYRVARYLGERLDNSWTLVRGYVGPDGEIDALLVGPDGVCAISARDWDGAVSVNGDRWSLVRYEECGSIVESGGKSPSERINDAAKPLEELLAGRGRVNRISRAVILAREESRVGEVEGLTIDYVGTLDGLRVADLFSVSDDMGWTGALGKA